MTDTPKKISDVQDYKGEEGYQKMKLGELFGVELLFIDFKKQQGKYGTFVIIHAEMKDKKIEVMTGSDVIIEALERLEPNLPLLGTFTRNVSLAGNTYFNIEDFKEDTLGV